MEGPEGWELEWCDHFFCMVEEDCPLKEPYVKKEMTGGKQMWQSRENCVESGGTTASP